MQIRERLRKLDLRAKMSLVILAVLVPVFSLLAFSTHFFLRPTLLREIEQIGVSAGKTLASEIVAQRLFQSAEREKVIESRVREFLYSQPNIRRIEIFAKDHESGKNVLVASSIEEDPADVRFEAPDVSHIISELHEDQGASERGWDIWVPIFGSSKATETKSIGSVRVVVSVNLVTRLAGLISNISMTVGGIGVILLYFLLNGALRKTMEVDRKLREAERKNLELSEQLHETERTLLNLEKFAVLGQLTASFAHEIGTPLNAIGGHLALLREEGLPHRSSSSDRIGIIESQLAKIASIVRGFLQSTAKPTSQKQLVDPYQVIEKTLSIVRPRLENLGVRIERDFDRSIGPIRMVPVHLEQVLLNLVNNSLDSIRTKSTWDARTERKLSFRTRLKKEGVRARLNLRIRDTGEGIRIEDLERVFQPFFTTKGPGEGTGLGLAICRDLIGTYHGQLKIESKAGEWTEVILDLPYGEDR